MYGFNQWKNGFGMGGGYRHGFGRGNGFGRGGGRGMGFGRFAFDENIATPYGSELETLKRYKEHLELRRKDLDSEIIAIERRISELEN